MKQFETERLIIRRFTADDWRDLYEYLSDESVVEFEPYYPYTEEASKEEAINRANNDAFWAVCLKENGKLIGNLYFAQEGPSEFGTWEIGYVFNPKFYGKGYATEASQRILRWAFEELGAHRIIGMCSPKNEASWKLLERLSMKREAYRRKPVFFKYDSEHQPIWHDSYEYAILDEDWNEMAKEAGNH